MQRDGNHRDAETLRCIYFCLLSLSLCLCGFVSTLTGQITTHFPSRQFDALSFRDAFWLSTPNGLYQYRSVENVWSVRGVQNGLLSNSITRIASDGEALWIGQDRGITVYNLQTNTMLSYDSTRGLPWGKVLSLAFEKDYVWVGTEHGAARYDRLIEEWQKLTSAQGLVGDSVFALIPRANALFMITNRAVNEYDARYERWRIYDGGESDLSVRDAFTTSANAWLLRDSTILRFHYDAKTFQRYSLGEIGSFSDIREIIIEGSTYWILTQKGLWYYDAGADALRPFLELVNVPDKNLRGITFSSDGKSIWFSTATGLSRYERQTKAWQYFTEASGMPTSEYRALFTYGNELVGIAQKQIAYYKQQENRWFTYSLLETERTGGAIISIDPAKGTFADFGAGYKLSLSGTRTSWLFKTSADSLQNFGDHVDVSKRNDLKTRFDIPGGRSMNATYNDADYSDLQYGAQYRGTPDDVVQSISLGDIRIEQGSKSFLQSFGIFGAGSRLTFGEKTKKYQRSLFELSAINGHKTTALTSDFFQGRSRITKVELRDIDYQRKIFYRLDTIAYRDMSIDAGSVTVFMTKSPTGPTTNNVLSESVIAGVQGQWLRLQEVKDYTVNAAQGIIQLIQPLPSNTALACNFRREGSSEFTTALLASYTSSRQEMKNIYFLRGASIFPGSMAMQIVDSSGTKYSLEKFGLDDNHTEKVNPRLVDYRNGILQFYSAFPFPPAAYEDSPTSTFTMRVQFESQSSGFLLSHNRLVRGSEKILVDGKQVRAGDDYILDYTSGFLLFIRDGVTGDDNRIEIAYEYVRTSAEEKYMQATATISPSDNLQGAATLSRFTPQGSREDATMIHGLAEARIQTEDVDVRIVPEMSRTTFKGESGAAFNVRTTLSTGALRFTLQSRSQSEKFIEPFIRLFPPGKLRSETNIQAEYDLFTTLRFFSYWKKRSGVDTVRSSSSSDEFGTIGVQWFEPGLPSITLRAENILDNVRDSSHHRQSIRGDLEYIPTPALLQNIGLTSAVFSSYVRISRAHEYLPGGDTRSFEFANMYFRAVISPRPLFTFNAYYRADVQDKQESTSRYLPYLSTEKLFADALMEQIRGLSLAIRYTRDLKTVYTLSQQNVWDTDSKHSFQISSRFSPGVLFSFFDPFTFEVNVRDDGSGYKKGGANTRPLFLSLFRSADATVALETGARLYEGKIEWRPTSKITYYATGRLSEGKVQSLSSLSKDRRRDITQRFDYRPGSRELYSARFTIIDSRFFNSHFTRYAPALYVENRWNGLLLTRFTLDAQYDSQWYGLDYTTTNTLMPSGNITLTFTDLPIIRRFEIRDDISFRTVGTTVDPIPYPGAASNVSSKLVVNTFYLDLYPHPSSYFRFQLTQQWNLSSSTSLPRSQTDASLQVTVQL